MLQADVGVRLGMLDLAVELEAQDGEVVALLGPNGAGKTTFLRALAGLVPLTRGRVLLDGVVLDDPARRTHVPTERRSVGLVFQDHLLFPHMSVLENVAFGLRCRGDATPRDAARRWLDRMGLGGYAEARPTALSGGQAQRVALARSLATGPRLLLMDEPLAALDATTRPQVRGDLRRLLAEFEGVRILVTHDPLEAMTLADRIVILEAGRVLQAGSAADIVRRPRSRYVADLAGVNLLRGQGRGDSRVDLEGGGSLVVAETVDGPVFVTIHPRAVALHRARPGGSPRNVWPGRVAEIDGAGDRLRVTVRGRPEIVAEVTPAAVRELDLAALGEVWVSVKATEIVVYPS